MKRTLVFCAALSFVPGALAQESSPSSVSVQLTQKAGAAVAESPYGEVKTTGVPNAVRSPEDGLRRVNFGLRMQNTKLTTEVTETRLVLADQNERLIGQANQILQLNTKLATTAHELGRMSASREGLLARIAQLEKTISSGETKSYDDFYAVMVFLAGLIAVLVILSLFTNRNTAAIVARVPTDDQKDLIETLRSDSGAKQREYEQELLRLRDLVKDEKNRADRIYEELMEKRKELLVVAGQNTKNADAMKFIVDQQALDFLALVEGGRQKEKALRALFESANELAEKKDFENDKLNGRLRALRAQIDNLEQKLASAKEKIVLLGGEEALET